MKFYIPTGNVIDNTFLLLFVTGNLGMKEYSFEIQIDFTFFCGWEISSGVSAITMEDLRLVLSIQFTIAYNSSSGGFITLF